MGIKSQKSKSLNIMRVKVIYEDDFLLAVDKPSGMVVNRSQTSKDNTLQDWLYAQGFGKGIEREGIVHRLDKETSGILLVAKTKESMENLQNQFKERQVTKMYIALVHGRLRPEKGEIKAAVSRNPFNRKKMGVFVGGKESFSRYQVVSDYENKEGQYSLVNVWPKTGRTHQIRVHMKYLNHPLVADDLYAGRKTSRNDRKWCKRLFLQAKRIRFSHPETGKKQLLEVNLADDLESVMDKLKKI